MSLSEESLPRQGVLPHAVEALLRTWSIRLAASGLVALAAFFWISLLTWQAQTAHNLSGADGNAFGPLGSIVSDLLLQSLGLAAVIAVLPLVCFAYELFRRERIVLASARLIFWIAGIVLVAGAFAWVPRPAAWPLGHGFGGFVGDFLHGVIARVLDTVEPALGGVIAAGLCAIGGAGLLLRTLNLRAADMALLFVRRSRVAHANETRFETAGEAEPRDTAAPSEPTPSRGRFFRRRRSSAPRPAAATQDVAGNPAWEYAPSEPRSDVRHAYRQRASVPSGAHDVSDGEHFRAEPHPLVDHDEDLADLPRIFGGGAADTGVTERQETGAADHDEREIAARFAPATRAQTGTRTGARRGWGLRAPQQQASGEPDHTSEREDGPSFPADHAADVDGTDEATENFPMGEPAHDPFMSAAQSGSRAPARARQRNSGFLSGRRKTKRGQGAFKLPATRLLARGKPARAGSDLSQNVLRGSASLLEDVLRDYGIRGEIVGVSPGPVVTRFELEPARGIKASRVISLADDIARSMSARTARIAVVPGRNALGIELPNAQRAPVLLRDLLEDESFTDSRAALPLALGRTIDGTPLVADLTRMPHLLVAGTTGSGKSVGINAMILSLVYKLPPERCRFLMIDPKMLELSVYNGIPHLLTPVVTDPEAAVNALTWAVREMEERYKKMSEAGVRNLAAYNARVAEAAGRGAHGDTAISRTVRTGFDPETGEPISETRAVSAQAMPFIVIVIDEMADLMMTAGKEIEATVQRLAQMARAAGIHLVTATQRPSVDVVTGTIKSNLPTRLSFRVATATDSRTILGQPGAETLLGAGDMLLSESAGESTRVHGPFVSEDEIEAVVAHLAAQGSATFVDGITEATGPDAGTEVEADADHETIRRSATAGDLYDKAVAIVLRDGKASTSYVQRRLSIGYNRAADLIERMERDGIVSAPGPTGRREVVADPV
ncbi:MAG: DNA translocase FtsK 4TM domain-containing protein [Pseudomonadota bacterium]